ncbi:right-handed parallel beta-helix repeat-containing protein [Halosimplex amylolyticum]|uniref:right-handed parallel beta-helix repeat-containing protein n=1 Tax=Halosimplex amylolyticum TaxID=3396616 RepID=UPI003F54921C
MKRTVQSGLATLVASMVLLSVIAPGVGLVGAANATTQINGCQTIDSPGTYSLSADVATGDTSNCIQINADDVTFDGNGHVIEFTGSNGPSAVSVSGGSNVVVTNVTTRYFGTGVRFYGATGGEISDVVVEPESGDSRPGAYGNGIALYGGSTGNLVRNNTVDRLGEWGAAGQSGSGIYVADSADNVIENNDVYDPADVGIQLEAAPDNTLSGNEIRGSPWVSTRTVRAGILLDTGSDRTTVDGNYVYGQSTSSSQVVQRGIYVRSADSVLTANTVRDVYWSGAVVTGDGTELDGNTFSSNEEHGLRVSGVTAVTATNNALDYNRQSGLSLSNVGSATVSDNTAIGNTQWAATLDSSGPLTVERLVVENGGPGVSFTASTASVDGHAPVEPPADRDDVDRFVEVEGSLSLDVHYTDTQVADVTEADLSMWNYDGSSWTETGGTLDAAGNTVSATVGTGVYAPLAPDTKAPAISNFAATSPADGRLAVSFDSDEALAALDVTVSNASGQVAALALADFTEAGSGTYTYENESRIAAGEYDVTLVTAADGNGNDGASGQTVQVTVTEPLEVTSFELIHAGDGDRLVVDDDVVDVSARVEGSDVNSVTVNANWFGAGTVYLSDPDGDGLYTGSFTVDVPYPSEGRKWLEVEAADGSGRTATRTAWLDLDTKYPTVHDWSITDADDDGVVGHGEDVTFVVELEDFSNVTVVAVTEPIGVPNVTLQPTATGQGDRYEGTVAVDAVEAGADGVKYVRIEATDEAGNSWWRSQWLVLDADSTGPEVTGATLSNRDGADDDVGDGDRIAVAATATDAFGVDTVSVDATEFGAGTVELADPDGDDVYEGEFTVDAANASIDGAYSLDVEAVNARGTSGYATTNALTLVTARDFTAPTLVVEGIDDPLGDGFVTDGDVITVRANASDAKSGVASVTVDASRFGAGVVALTDGDGDGHYDGTFTVDAASADPDGFLSLTVTATDASGNANSDWRYLELDRSIATDATAPTIHEFRVDEGPGRDVAVAVNASEPLARLSVEIRDDAGTLVATLDEHDFDTLSRSGPVTDGPIDGGPASASMRAPESAVPTAGSSLYVALASVPANGTYTGTLVTAVDRAGNDGAGGESATAAVGPLTEAGSNAIRVDGTITTADGSPAAGDAIVLLPDGELDVDDGLVGQTDANGEYSLLAPKGPTYHVLYVQINASGGPAPADGSPDLFTLGSVADNATLSRALPSAHAVTFRVVERDSGAGVAGARVNVSHETSALLGLFGATTGADGRLTGSGAANAIELAGIVHAEAAPSAESGLAAAATTVTVDGPREIVLSLPSTGQPSNEVAADETAVDGDSARVTPDSGPVSELDFAFDDSVTGTLRTATLRSLDTPGGKSALATQIGGLDGVVANLSLDVSGLSDPDVGATVTITLDLPAGVSASSLTVARFDDDAGQWESLPTTVVSTSGSTATIRFTTPGFSTFAVVSQPSEESTDNSSDDRGPTADAGSDRTVESGGRITLDGTGSGDGLTYEWTQVYPRTDPPVTIRDADSSRPTVTAPTVESRTEIEIRLTVSDGSGGTDADIVDVVVLPESASTDTPTDAPTQTPTPAPTTDTATRTATPAETTVTPTVGTGTATPTTSPPTTAPSTDAPAPTPTATPPAPATEAPTAPEDATATATSADGPGFTPIGTLAALGAALIAMRRRDER